MDNNVSNIIKKLEALGEVKAKKALVSLDDPSTEAKKLENFFKGAEETFKKETGNKMDYSTMRAMFG
jgi:hypothetical protein